VRNRARATLSERQSVINPADEYRASWAHQSQGDGSGWQYCSVQDKEAHSLEKADVDILRASWTCAADYSVLIWWNPHQWKWHSEGPWHGGWRHHWGFPTAVWWELGWEGRCSVRALSILSLWCLWSRSVVDKDKTSSVITGTINISWRLCQAIHS